MGEIGVIDDMERDDIDRELRRARLTTEVDEELERLKKEVEDQ
jgi:phage shock protein A